MREIKFRAWTPRMSMIYDCFTIHPNGYIQFFEGILMSTHQMITNGFILMQYTGLKDKNGKEIYEGDIVKTFYSWMYGCIGVIEFILIDSAFRILFNKIHQSVIRTEQCEIIGNIYENPELLERRE